MLWSILSNHNEEWFNVKRIEIDVMKLKAYMPVHFEVYDHDSMNHF